MNSLKLISFTARYYDNTKMTNLFSKITSQMITNCIDYILDNMVNRESKEAKENGKTVIIVTHNSALADMADHLIKMRNGKLIYDEYNPNPKRIEDIEW